MTAQRKGILVVGAGAVGLRTALELVRRTAATRRVVLRSPVPPTHPSVCSMGAGGLWMPFHCDDVRVDRWAVETLRELLDVTTTEAPAEDDTTTTTASLVEQVPAVYLRQHHGGPRVTDFVQTQYTAESGGTTASEALPTWTTADPRLDFQHLTVEMLSWQNTVHRLRIPTQDVLTEAGYLYAWLFRPPIVNAPAMLEHMLQQLQKQQRERDDAVVDVDVETGRYYRNLDEMRAEAEALDCDTVVNCTGFGSRDLLDDTQLVGARGVLLRFDRRTCVRNRRVAVTGLGEPTTNDAVVMGEELPWGTDAYPTYLIARGDDLVVGGTYLEGDAEPALRDAERTRLLHNAELLGIDTTRSPVKGEWVGFRPYRPTVRCEYDDAYGRDCDGVSVYHNYGHGGSGWTVNVGAAKECVDDLLRET